MASSPTLGVLLLAAEVPTLKHFSEFANWKVKLYSVAGDLGLECNLDPRVNQPTGNILEHQVWKANDELAKKLIMATTSLYDSAGSRLPESNNGREQTALEMLFSIELEMRHREAKAFEKVHSAIRFPNADFKEH